MDLVTIIFALLDYHQFVYNTKRYPSRKIADLCLIICNSCQIDRFLLPKLSHYVNACFNCPSSKSFLIADSKKFTNFNLLLCSLPKDSFQDIKLFEAAMKQSNAMYDRFALDVCGRYDEFKDMNGRSDFSKTQFDADTE